MDVVQTSVVGRSRVVGGCDVDGDVVICVLGRGVVGAVRVPAHGVEILSAVLARRIGVFVLEDLFEYERHVDLLWSGSGHFVVSSVSFLPT